MMSVLFFLDAPSFLWILVCCAVDATLENSDYGGILVSFRAILLTGICKRIHSRLHACIHTYMDAWTYIRVHASCQLVSILGT